MTTLDKTFNGPKGSDCSPIPFRLTSTQDAIWQDASTGINSRGLTNSPNSLE